jgi:hypothetical protein
MKRLSLPCASSPPARCRALRHPDREGLRGAQTVANLIDDVNTALSTGELHRGAGDAGRDFGECAIVAAVKDVANKAGIRGQYDDVRKPPRRSARGRGWPTTSGSR